MGLHVFENDCIGQGGQLKDKLAAPNNHTFTGYFLPQELSNRGGINNGEHYVIFN